ncbi:MAG: hypothetical protein ACRDGA_09470 [Bacteroidota bacterium]
MNLYHGMLVLFVGTLLVLGFKLAKKVREYRSTPDDETKTERFKIQAKLRQQLERDHDRGDQESVSPNS